MNGRNIERVIDPICLNLRRRDVESNSSAAVLRLLQKAKVYGPIFFTNSLIMRTYAGTRGKRVLQKSG